MMEEDKDVIRHLLAISCLHAHSYDPNLAFFENLQFEVITIAIKNLTCYVIKEK